MLAVRCLHHSSFVVFFDISPAVASQRPGDAVADDDFAPHDKAKVKAKTKLSTANPEMGRVGLHTLDEQHEFLLSASFEGNGSFLGLDPSSSQVDPAGHLGSLANDDIFMGTGGHMDYGMDLGADIGDDLARELGEGWGLDTQNFGVVYAALHTLDKVFAYSISTKRTYGGRTPH